MTTYRSYKWVSSDSKKAIIVDPTIKDSVFGTVSKQPCNLISIFGRARQGKSFLMNCLAGERDIFRISNEKDSCTQGIDISNKWLSLNDFSQIDGGKIVTGKGMKVGFVDAEGQGDKDVSYDANLICPILLTSKCVIFNWKGDLQKDHMLSTLGIMARAASNIANSTSNSSRNSSNSAKFGHLHIIFRDWQAIDSDADSVEKALLGLEETSEAAMRDKIRKDLFASFQSIRVWLFEAPTDYVKDLRQKLTFEKTNQAFRGQLRQLRGALVDQLTEPTYVAGTDGVVLTGKAYAPLTAQIANALNHGRVVLPSSAYLGMMRDEVDKIHREYEEELTKNMNRLLALMDELDIHLPASSKSGQRLYASESMAIKIWSESVDAIAAEYEKKKSEVFGEIVSGAVTTLRNDLNSQIVRVNEASKQQYLALYNRQFGKWLINERQRAENYLDSKLNIVEFEINSANSSDTLETEVCSSGASSGCQWPICEEELATLLSNVLQYAIEMIGGEKCYPHNSEVLDAVNVLSRHFRSSESRIKQAHESLIERGRGKANEFLEQAKRVIDIYLQESVDHLKREHQHGYSIITLEGKLNKKYFEVKKQLDEQIHPIVTAHAASVYQQFDDHCMELRDKMLTIYSNAKDNALKQLLSSLEEKVLAGPFNEIPAMLEKQAIKIHHGSKDELYRDDAMQLLPVILPPLQEGAVQTAIKHIKGWLLLYNEDYQEECSKDPSDLNELDRFLRKEEQFIEELRRMVAQAFDNFQAQLLSSLPEEPAVEMEEDDYSCDEDVSEDDVEEPPKSSVKRGGSLSVTEQKRLAREWACSNLGLKKVGRKNERLVSTNPRSRITSSNRPGIKRGKNASNATPAKSLEQQRKDALEFAIQQFGPDIAFSPPTDAVLRRSSLRTNSSRESTGKRSSSEASLDDSSEYNNRSKKRQPFRQSIGETSGISSLHSEESSNQSKSSSSGSSMDCFVPNHGSEAIKSTTAHKSDAHLSSGEKENSVRRSSTTPVKKTSAVALAKMEAKKKQEERANAAAERLKQKKLQKNK